jgi:hypothetical protein
MVASLALGYVTVALDLDRLTQLGVIGPVIAGFFALIGKMYEVAATSRQQKLARQNRSGPSAVNGFLFGIMFAAVLVAVYFYNHPRGEVVTASDPPVLHPTVVAEAPITVEEASTVVATYLEKVDSEETVEQAWDMFTDAFQAEKAAEPRGKERYKSFWKSVDTVRATGGLVVIEGPTAARVVVQVPVKFNMIPELIAPDKSPCSTEKDDFTIVRLNGVLQIAGAQISPGSYATC